MSFRRALGWGAMQSLLRMALGMISVKITASILGPSGVALLAQLGNLLSLISAVSSNGVNTAVTRFTAEHQDEPEKAMQVFSSGLRLSLVISTLLSIIFVLLDQELAQWLFRDVKLAWIIKLLAVATPFIIIAPFLLGFFTGLKEFTTTSTITMVSQLISFALFVLMTSQYGVAGGMAAVIIGNGIVFFVALPWGIAKRFFSKLHFIAKSNKNIVFRILRFFPLAIVRGSILPLVLFFIRDDVIDLYGVDVAGHWQAVWRVSEVYLGVLSSTLGLYFMAHISAINEPQLLAHEIRSTAVKMFSLTAILALGIYVLRNIVVLGLYTPEFLPMLNLFGYQLLGDVMWMTVRCLSMVLVSKDLHRWYVALEIIIPVLFLAGVKLGLERVGVIAVPMAYAAAYSINLLMDLFALRHLIFTDKHKVVLIASIYGELNLFKMMSNKVLYILRKTYFFAQMGVNSMVLIQSYFRNSNNSSFFIAELSSISLAILVGVAVAVLDNKLTIIIVPFIILIVLIMRDYRVGVVLLAIILPITNATFMPTVAGFSPISYLSLAALLSFGLSRMSSRKELIWLPKWLWLFYLAPVSLAALIGIPHLSEVPSYMLATGAFDSVTPVRYIKDLLINPMLIVVWMWLLMHAVRDSKRPEYFIGVLAFAAMLPAALTIVIEVTSGLSLQFLAGGSEESRKYLEITGLHPNEMGILLASAFGPLIFSAPNARSMTGRLALWSALAIVTLGLLLTFSRGAFVAACVSVLFFLIRAKGSKLVKYSIVLMIIVMFAVLGSSLLMRISEGWSGSASSFSRASAVTAARTDIWLALWPEVEKHPILGGGLGSTAWSAAAHSSIFPTHPHNLYLQILLDTGFVGLILLLVFYWRFAKTLTKAVSEDSTNQPPPLVSAYLQGAYAALLGYLLEALSNGYYTPVHDNTLLWASLGLGLAYTSKLKVLSKRRWG